MKTLGSTESAVRSSDDQPISRWNEALVTTKTNKPVQKDRENEVRACVGGKQNSSSAPKSSGKSSKGCDSTAGGKVVGNRGRVSHQATRPSSQPAKPALRLRSSRSFSSLQASSFTATPFMRSSRSLSRLDKKSAENTYNTNASSQVRKGQGPGRTTLDSSKLLSSVERISFTQLQPPSSSVVSTAICHPQTTKEKKQIKDGVYTLCAMTAGVKRNWVQAVFKNVQLNHTQRDASSLAESKEDDLEDCEESRECQQELTSPQHIEGAQSLADLDSSSSRPPVSPSPPHVPTPANLPQQVEETDEAQTVETTKTAGVIDASISFEGFQSDISSSTVVLSDGEDFKEHTDTETAAEQPSSQECETKPQKEEQQVSVNPMCAKDQEALQTGQLVKELQQTQRELSRIQQINKNLQDELQQERENNSGKLLCAQDINSSPKQALTFQQLQRINHNLCMEIEELKRSQEEAREAELRRRVDLLAQQAQLLVTGDATALAQMHLDQDRQRFLEQQQEWEHRVASLEDQLNISEEKRRETQSQVVQLQQELQGQQSLQQEAEQLQKHLQEMSAQLRTYEDAQAEKEARLQKHLLLLQASQERERRSLAASLAQAEGHSQDLRNKLERAEQQLESQTKTKMWTRQIEEAQQQLQQELACTVSAMQRLQKEREQLDHRCQELQSQLSEADREVGRLQDRLKTEETHYYNLEHSYEKVCEELQVALGKVQQRESETQDIREGYERLLDRKEQELSEVLLKMEVLGNSLEETEVKLSEVMRVCTCSSPKLKDKDRQPTLEPPSSLLMKVFQGNDSNSLEHARTRSRSVDASCQYITAAGDDPERFMTVIQLLETKLFITEEKLRDITQRLEEHQGHVSCQDPHLWSQLTQSRAAAQHLSLLLHSQAKQNQRFAQETECCCRMLVGRFQVALNVVQACMERLQATPVNIPDIERHLAGVAVCLQKGEKEAERLQQESRSASKEEGKILNDEKLAGVERDIVSKFTNTQPSHDMSDVGKYLIKELFVVEKMVSVLQNQNGICELSAVKKEDKGDVVHSYKNFISQILSLKAEERMESRRTECDSDQLLESVIGRFCAEAELIYAALKLQQQSVTQVNGHDQREGLADISPSELSSYEEQVKGSDEAVKKLGEARERGLLERIVSRLQKRAKFLSQVCQELSDNHTQVQEGINHSGDNVSEADLMFFQEQVKLIYLSDRLYSDINQEFQQSKASQNNPQDLCKEQELSCLMHEQEVLNDALNQLQEDNSVLREELERATQKIMSVDIGNQRLLEDMQKIEDYHKEQRQKLEAEFQEKIKELQQIHEEEMKQLHGYYSKSGVCKERQNQFCTEEVPPLTGGTSSVPDQAVSESNVKEFKTIEADGVTVREAYLKDLEKLQASCDLEFAAMEGMHKKVIKDLQQEHQKQVAELLKEKDQLLQEETAATMSAIVALRRAHKKELERSRQTQQIRESGDITELHVEYEKEIQLLQRELEVLSDQHTKKCLENSQLSQELQNERESVMQYQRENQELKQKREPEEVTRLPGNPAQVDNFYQMEMTLRAKEAEMQHLREEALSLRGDLELARMDKVYAENKLKALHTNNYNEAKFATWSPSRDTSGHRVEDSVTHNPAIKKKEKSSFLRQIRGFRSRSLKDGLSTQERKKLFESS
ncbi:putative leucine-rich repeat-containing protein DDB_G0290503 isoform X2 [Girardinichthys multiradiatus]|uniref:putative leucine-rich repeat-containing protein DDB_G0290503 isoform X2 n=1 Tax=Girardinichthys multiradiatus TaxID=208333 RepID=UPI001FAB825F|nr:putative leucine-rich repeat-containing protein DDB_G0290503 isoform X2 [Girardinichthys multiradiatus]